MDKMLPARLANHGANQGQVHTVAAIAALADGATVALCKEGLDTEQGVKRNEDDHKPLTKPRHLSAPFMGINKRCIDY
jgi:hypothetical protein